MRENLGSLVYAVHKAIGRELDPEPISERTLLHDGCFLLNYWGNEPRYRYG